MNENLLKDPQSWLCKAKLRISPYVDVLCQVRDFICFAEFSGGRASIDLLSVCSIGHGLGPTVRKKKSKRQFHLSSAIYAALQFYLSSLYISSPSTRKCDDAVLNTILLFTGDIRYDGVLCGSAWNGTKQLNGMAIQEIYAEEKTTFSCRYFSIAMWFISIKGLRAGLDLVLHKCWTYSKFFLLH